MVNRDVATVLLRAFSDAHPLSPRGVKEALERVKMMPAAAGAPGHPSVIRQVDPPRLDGRRLPGRRTLDPDGINSHLVDRFGAEG